MNMAVECCDGRALNAMDGETKMVHLRLEAWGQWAKGDRLKAWPRRTVLGRLEDEGPGAGHMNGHGPTTVPEPIAEVDAAVAHLGEIDQRVIKRNYMHWEPIEAMAKAEHMRVRQFRAVLTRARWRVSGFLNAMNSIC